MTVCYCAVIFFISSRVKADGGVAAADGGIPHFIEYAGLGTLAWAVVWLGRPFLTGSGGFTQAAFCALYAISDEIHQSFVPLRSCEGSTG